MRELCSALIRDGLLTSSKPDTFKFFEWIGRRAMEWEHKADELEETVFHLTLLKPGAMEEETLLPLLPLPDSLSWGQE